MSDPLAKYVKNSPTWVSAEQAPAPTSDSDEAWIQEALRLADEHGRHWVLDGPARRAALEAHLRGGKW